MLKSNGNYDTVGGAIVLPGAQYWLAIVAIMVSITGSAFTTNLAQHGGAISIGAGKVLITRSTFTSNVATGTDAPLGGAVSLRVDNHDPPYARAVSFVGCEFTSNSASGGSGGAIYSGVGNVSIIASTFTITSNTAQGSALALQDPGYGHSAVSVIGSTFASNNDTCGRRPNDVCGSAIYVMFYDEDHNLNFHLANVTFIGNLHAIDCGAGFSILKNGHFAKLTVNRNCSITKNSC